MKNNTITYIFGVGRERKLAGINNIAKEFFYGYDLFKKEFENTQIIELNESKNISSLSRVFIFFDRAMIKISNMPFFMHQVISLENFKKILRSDYLIITNERNAFSSLPMILLAKVFKKINITIIIMGLFSKEPENIIKSKVNNLLIILLAKTINNFIFLSEEEHIYACNEFKKFESNFFFLPFAIDTEFWNIRNQKPKLTNDILFVGNDGKREYNLLSSICKNMPEYRFIIVSNQVDKNKLNNLPNLVIHNGSWKDSNLSDKELKEIYAKSKLTIIPIKNTLQPSGQSVALQSYMSKTPVLITKTKGFWDYKEFKDNENIYFIEKNELDYWTNKIKSILNNQKHAQKVSLAGYDVVKKNYNLHKFYEGLKKIIKL